MSNETTSRNEALPRPPVADRAAFQAELESLRTREKAHTREAAALAAARRRLPMVEVDPAIPVTGPDGPVPLIEAFEGRQLLIAYYFMWRAGLPAAEQCEGCTFYTTQVAELSYLHSRDITWAVFGDRVFETYTTTVRGVQVVDYNYALMDLTVYGRQESWEDSPSGWPQQCSVTRTATGPPTWAPVTEWPGGRPIAQWSRLAAGRSDDLGTSGEPAGEPGHCH